MPTRRDAKARGTAGSCSRTRARLPNAERATQCGSRAPRRPRYTVRDANRAGGARPIGCGRKTDVGTTASATTTVEITRWETMTGWTVTRVVPAWCFTMHAAQESGVPWRPLAWKWPPVVNGTRARAMRRTLRARLRRSGPRRRRADFARGRTAVTEPEAHRRSARPIRPRSCMAVLLPAVAEAVNQLPFSGPRLEVMCTLEIHLVAMMPP